MRQKLTMDIIFKTGETVSEQVVRVLVPLMKELKAEIRGVKEDISHLNESVNGLRETVSSLEGGRNHTASELNMSIASHTQQLSHVMDMMNSLDSKLVSVNTTMREDLTDMKECLNNLSEAVNGQSVSMSQTASEISVKIDTLDSKLVSVNINVKENMTDMKECLRNLSEVVNSHSVSVSEGVSDLKKDLEKSRNTTASELADLHTSLQSSINNTYNELRANMEKLNSKLCSVNDTVVSTLETVSNINETVSNVSETVDTHTEQLEGLVSYIKRDLRDLELQQEERIVTKVAQLHTSLQSSISEGNIKTEQMTQVCNTVVSELESINASMTEELSQLKDEVDNAHGKCCTVDDMSSFNDSMSRMRDAVTRHDQNMTTRITKLNVDIWQNITSVVRPETYECGDTRGWSRVAYLDMKDPNTTCPSGWQLTRHFERTCGRASSGSLTCDSVIFPVSGGDYTRVCGRIIGYQYNPTDAFEAYDDGDVTTIDEAYVSGVSLTRGSPRQHIWTFAAGRSEALPNLDDVCPCDATINITIPPFVGGDYFCESGANFGYHGDDPLWDGEGCSASSTCCSFNDPPYFTKQLSSPTSDDIEARICQKDNVDDTPIEFIELYVQHSNIPEKLIQLREKVENLNSTLLSMNAIWQNITSTDGPAMYTCGCIGGWRRVAYLDMRDPNTTCPSGWQLTGHSKRTCGRASSGSLTCDSVNFPVRGGDYTSVCGRIIGYQFNPTDAFEAYHDGDVATIEEAYVSGVSLTHGSPRQHIWTFAAGRSENQPAYDDACPCDVPITITVPSLVGGDYFCESGVNSGSSSGFHPDDPLWDGEGCSANSTCCSFNDPPYFTKQLSSPTSDDIEVRICLLDAADDTPIEFIELYVQ